MAKKKPPVLKRTPTAGEVAKWQKQERRNRIVFILGTVVIVAIVALLGYGYYDRVYKENHAESNKLHKTVIQVNEDKFNLQYVIDVVNFLNIQAQADNSTTGSLKTYTINDAEQLIEYNELLIQAAPELGISIAGNELDTRIREIVVPQSAPTDYTEEQYLKYYSAYLKAYHINDREFRDLLTAEMLRPKLQDYLKTQVPTSAEQVHIQGVLINETMVTEVADRLVFTSDNLNDIAPTVSVLSSGQSTADLGWMVKGIMGSTFDDAVFSLEPGVLSEPIPDETNQYPNAEWLVSVLEKESDRPLDDAQKQNLAAVDFSKWFTQKLQQGLATKQVVNNLDDALKIWAKQYMDKHPITQG